MTPGEPIEAGRAAFEQRSWAEAYELVGAADRSTSLGPEDLELLAKAAYLAGRDEDSAAAWGRAHQAFLDAGDPARAVYCAFWLGFGLLQRGDAAQGGGWFARAQRIGQERELECAEVGYLLVPAALMAIGGGDPARGIELCEEASRIADRFGDGDLRTFGRLGRGQALLRLGRVAEGVACFDEVMVSVLAGEVSPVVSGIAYCAVIEECHRIFDVRRAHEWTAALARWCAAQPSLVPYRGQCLVHRSQVLQLHGEWSDALVEAQRAATRLAEPPHPAIGLAHYQLGELHRLRGELSEAHAAYRRARECGRVPQPGAALATLAEGRVEAAAAAIDAAMAEAHDTSARAELLPAHVEIMLEAGRIDAAREAAGELEELASAVGAEYLAAAATAARGLIALACGDAREALEPLRRAWRHWEEVGAPYEAARTQVRIALAYRDVGDHDSAKAEREAARAVLERMGAAVETARIERLFGGRTVGGASGITPRETEVLRLVASGRTNREIAEQLVISEKTVERHVSNLFTKLDVSNRAAATAAAYDLGLV